MTRSWIVLVACMEGCASGAVGRTAAPDVLDASVPIDVVGAPDVPATTDVARPFDMPSTPDTEALDVPSSVDTPLADAPSDVAPPPVDVPPPPPPPCTTTVTYGSAWTHPAGHPSNTDTVAGVVTWDGTCTDDGANSYATLSNGWQPYFTGHQACVIALDSSNCPSVPPGCETRVSYGAAWIAPTGHTARYDDVAGRVTTNGACGMDGADAYATLSNGWAPHYAGAGTCGLSFRYTQCGGLYQNAVVPDGCADPGVLHDGGQYYLTCTSGDAADAFPLRVSTDLVHWTLMGSVFPAGHWPMWARSDFWAPEIHRVGTTFVVYYTARGADGVLAVGAATATSPLGPFTDPGHPLVHNPAMGSIDPSEFDDASGAHYVVWKDDGNAIGQPTPIHGQRLAADGMSLAGSPTTLITNDQPWEGAVVEAPMVRLHGGGYYLFYSGNSYANASYAVGVARASSPLGPYTKAPAPIVTTEGSAWVGPGHCFVTDTPAGDAMVYHAWPAGHVNGPGDVRVGLVDDVQWGSTWPMVYGAPSSRSLPMP